MKSKSKSDLSSKVAGLARVGWVSCWLLVLWSLTVADAHGQNRPRKEREKEVPPPETVVLSTRDGFTVKGTFYGSVAGKQAVPIIILHDYNENRIQYDGLAKLLQANQHAVLTLDLRGHGESTRYRAPGETRDRTLEAKNVRKPDILRMAAVGGELESAKRFLMEKNNAGELNIEKLCVIGTGLGGLVAVNWAALDWSWPPLTTGKQGQDVRALVLIAPVWTFQGVQIRDALSFHPIRSQLSMLLFASGRNKNASGARQIYNTVKNFHPEPPPDQLAEKKDLFFRELDTSLRGAKLLDKALDVPALICDFIDLRLVKKEIPWSERNSPVK